MAVWARSVSKRWFLKRKETFKAIGLKLRKVLVLKTEGPCGTLENKTIVLGHFFNSSYFWIFGWENPDEMNDPPWISHFVEMMVQKYTTLKSAVLVVKTSADRCGLLQRSLGVL